MSENVVFETRPTDTEKKPIHTSSLVLGILAIVFGLLSPIVSYVLGIVGISRASRNRLTHRTTAGLVCSIVGLSLAAINHILGIVLQLSALA